jgi:hypothetical protein
LLSEGIRDLGVKEGFQSDSLRSYYNWLVANGHYSKSFEEFFPPQRPNDIGYDQIVFLDMTKYNIKQEVNITVKVLYNNNMLPLKWDLNAFCIVQEKVTYQKASNKWSYEDVI